MDKLWVDKYRPSTLENLDYNQQLTEQLSKLSEADDFPHLLFYGLNGSGKKTRVMSFLHDVYGPSISKLKQEVKEFKTSSNQIIELNIIYSCFHIDITPSEAGFQDRIIIQSLLKEIASTHQLDKKIQKPFKVVVINEVDQLSREAQAALRRTMEKYVSKCRLILICENIGKVLAPLRSRCLTIRVPSPHNNCIKNLLIKISLNENFILPENLAMQIAIQSERNIRKAILQLQSIRMKYKTIDQNIKLHHPEWRQAINSIAKQILDQQTPQNLRLIRDSVYQLLINCINPELIIKYCLIDLMQYTDKKIKNQLVYWAAYHQNKMIFGQKPIFHIEAFIARAMLIIQSKMEIEY